MKGIEQVLVNLKEQVEKIDQEIGAIAAKYRIQRSQQKVAVVIPCYYFPHNYCDCNHLFFFLGIIVILLHSRVSTERAESRAGRKTKERHSGGACIDISTPSPTITPETVIHLRFHQKGRPRGRKMQLHPRPVCTLSKTDIQNLENSSTKKKKK
jgi:hypothetical protein